MKVLGITAEYNPFHNGHKYHLDRSRETSGADCVVVAMSGNFTQRGEPAIFDKWARSRIAITAGADLVVELPFLYACSRAEIFARGAVDLLHGMGASIISFGSESGNLTELISLVENMENYREDIADRRKDFMKDGCSFAKGHQLAVEEILGADSAALLMEPNNILALEYLKRMRFWECRGESMEAMTVRRLGAGHGSCDTDGGFVSAAAIRELIETMNAHEKCGASADAANIDISALIPAQTAAELDEAASLRQMEAVMFRLIQGIILRSSADELSQICCMGEGIEYRLKREITEASSYDDLLSRMVSRRYTESTIRRLLTYVLLGVRRGEPQGTPYARVLAANETGRRLLRETKDREGTIPILTNINKEAQDLPEAGEMLRYDVLASDMYNVLRGRKPHEFSDKVIKPYVE